MNVRERANITLALMKSASQYLMHIYVKQHRGRKAHPNMYWEEVQKTYCHWEERASWMLLWSCLLQMLEGVLVWCRMVCPSFAAWTCASNSKHLNTTQATVLAGSPDVCNNTLCPQLFYGELCLIFRSTCEFNCYKAGFYRNFMNTFYRWDLPCIKFAYISDNKLHSCCTGHYQMSLQGSRGFSQKGEKNPKSWYKAQLIKNWRAKIELQ